MKRSELKEFIKGEILVTLTEASAEDVNNQKDLNKELEKTAAISKELGLEENGEKDYWADYTDIGMFYLEAHGNMYQGKEQKLTDSQYEKLGKKIVDQLYDGDVGKAYDETYKAVKGNELKYKGSVKEEIPASSMLKINSSVTTVATAAQSMLDFFDQMAEKETMDFLKNANFKIAIDKFKKLVGDKGEVTENEDEEKTEKDAVAQAKAARGKHKKLDIAVKALKDITTEMKSIAREYSKADGVEKEKIKDQLKTKTAKKKELESLVAKLEKNVI